MYNLSLKNVMFSSIKSHSPLLMRGCLVGVAVLVGLPSWSMDTDIFSSVSSAGTPNVLLVIDNTANWSRNSQKFPDGAGGTITQGQAEIAAVRTIVDALPGNINIGLMEFATDGTANDTGGYIRQAIVPMGSAQGIAAATNRTDFKNKLTTIFGDINGTHEKINSGTPYGDLMWDAYNYYRGAAPSVRSGAVNATRADSAGYLANYSQFKAPVSASTSCAANHLIFIGNPPANGPSNDSSTNAAALTAANGGAVSQLALAPYSETTTAIATKLGYSSSCYASQPTGTPTDYASLCPGGANATYDSCRFDLTDSKTTMNACPSGQSRYAVLASTPNSTSSSTVVTTSTAPGATACYASASAASADTGGMTCPANTISQSGNITTTTSYSCTYVIGAPTGSACTATPVVSTGAALLATSTATKCSQNDPSNASGNNLDRGSLLCPSPFSSTNGGVTTATTYACTYSGVAGSGLNCSNNQSRYVITQRAVPTITTTGPSAKYAVTQTQTKSVTTTTAATGSTVATLGNSLACYSIMPTGAPAGYACPTGASCLYGAQTASATCPAGKVYQVQGILNTLITAPTGRAAVTDTATYNADEWARFMNVKGFDVRGMTSKVHVRTHTIDVFGAQPNGVQSSLLNNMSHYGGGGYYTATNPDQIRAALDSIFGEISATNSVFASAALPISATTRTQNDNQVYIGMFRPDQQSLPRWMGNVKRFQLGLTTGGYTDLVDAQSPPIPAINSSTGFLTPCAHSSWTTDTGNYWATVNSGTGTVTPKVFFTQASNPGLAWRSLGDDTVLATGGCANKPAYSDLPDGAVVEKGGAAQMMRNAVSRKVLTLSGSTLVDFNTTNVTTLSNNSTINNNIVNFIAGKDVTGEINGLASDSWRPSIHGAVIHSRPLPVNFGGTTGVKVYYGSNDGTFRAIDATTGKEDWAFVPTESYSSLQRQMDNTPFVQSPSPPPPSTSDTGGTPKDFYFDGSTGLYQSGIGSGSSTWIFPSMRRGGRMLHAFDVSDPAQSPVFKWKVGCPNLADDVGCTANMANIGQTWSTPTVAFLPGFSQTIPVLIVGGGYDACEDADSASPACSTAKGKGIYVLNAFTGAVIKSFATDRSVAADVVLIDANRDGIVDFAYAADTGGSIYRVNFSNPSTFAKLADSSLWTMTKVAYTSGANRKFLFPPALISLKNQVYVAIGSGDREHPTAQSYPYTAPVLNRAYVYRDDLTTTNFNLDTLTNNTAADKNTCSAEGLQTASNKGWLLNLNAYGQGEQTVTSALISAGLVFFSTNRPTPAAVCSPSLGEARGYAVNLLNGSGGIGVNPTCGGDRSSIFAGGGLAPSPVSGVVTVNGVVQNILVGAPKLDGSASTPFGAQKLNPNINKSRTRIFWKTNTDTK